MRTRALRLQETQNDDVLACEEEGRSPEASSASSSSEYEEYTDSEGEEVGPRLKPVFVRRRDRVTVLEREKETQKAKASELEARRVAEEKRKQALRLVEDEIRKDSVAAKAASLGGEAQLNDVDTDTDNDEADYEAWKLRELRRVRRDREERENVDKERIEIERLRGLTEEERRAEMRSNPRQITNKAAKGKYKFLQKYYHRGVYYMDQDQELLRRDFSAATLEDHFDKTVLPKVMQVKNFGRSGRTKYTHLVDQDSTQFDSPWVSETAQNLKFATTQAAGMKQLFDRPSQAKRKQ